MIAIDTNVLVRYLVQDDAAQARIASAIIDGVAEADDEIFVSDVVLVETAWVLGRAYDVRRSTLAEVVLRLADARHVVLRDDALVRRAVGAFASGKGDFADYFARELAREAGCDELVTFDRALWREPGFTRAKTGPA